MKLLIRQFLLLLIFSGFTMNSEAQTPFAVPTYHCMGVYWSPAGGSPDKDVLVQYRKLGSTEWKQGLNMEYLPIAETTVDKADYRGSIVNLTPNTIYEIKLTLEGTDVTETFTGTTWSEDYPIGTVTAVGSQSTTYKIDQSGTPDAYRVYDGEGDTIDVRHKHDYCIIVEASYVIIRNLVLRGAGDTAILDDWPPRSAILLDGELTDVIIEHCDIADWGTPNVDPIVPGQGESYESAIYARKPVERITIQRCKLHNPTYTSNSWKDGDHPDGPQCITFFDSKGNNVIRYNECWSDSGHYFNDVIGGGSNASYKGFPGDNSDIYCNYVANCWDDGIEAEGADQNVRIWNNYITNTLMAIGNAPVSVGPLYVWRNVSGISYSPPPNWTYYNFLKMGFASSLDWMTGNMYVFHNTIYNVGDQGYDGLGGERRAIRHCTSRNNILSVRDESNNSISTDSTRALDNDFDYDLYNKRVPTGSESHGIKGLPVYVSNAGFDFSSKTGNFQLVPFSPGFDEGEVIPNFSDGYKGAAPDMGAQERGWDNFVYGVNAVFRPEEITYAPVPERGRSIRIYPNPFVHHVTFNLLNLPPCNIIITDITGKVVRKLLNKTGEVMLERGNLSPGIYLYRIVSENDIVDTGKLIILR